nr:MAG TPA: hypothetical protein [Caudoviricetes sp.]
MRILSIYDDILILKMDLWLTKLTLSGLVAC